MVEPLALPESVAVESEQRCRTMPRPALEILECRLESLSADFAEQVQVCWHDNVFKGMPGTGLVPVLNCFNNHLSDFRVLKMYRPFCTIEPVLHLAENRPLQEQPVGRVAVGELAKLLGPLAKPFPASCRYCTCQVDRDEIPSILYFPMRQTACPE